MRAADFVQETTTSIAGTAGNGAVTLTAITGLPRFSSALGSSKTNVRYVIEDTVNNKFEQGIGSVAANVLTRTRPQVTWDGTTWKDASSSAVALAFGSTPTAGNVVVRMAPTAEAAASAAPAFQSSVGGSAWRDYQISEHIKLDNSGSAAGLTANTQYFCIYKQTTAGWFSGIQLEVMTAVTSSHLLVGLYDFGSDGLPGNLLVTCNIIDSSTTGVKTDTAISTWTPTNGIWLTPGWYCVALLSDAAIGVRAAPGQNGNNRSPFGNLANGYGYSMGCSVAQSYASGLQPTISGSVSLAFSGGGNYYSSAHIGLKVVA